MNKYNIYAIKLQNNSAKEPSILGQVDAPNKKQAIGKAYHEFAHLLSMYFKESLFAIRLPK